MALGKEKILELVKEYIEEKDSKDKWIPGEDWVSYSGPHFDSKEYIAAVSRLLDGWMIFGEKARQFEFKFSGRLGKKHGMLTNSGSSANLLMTSALTSLRAGKFQLKAGDKVITPIVCFPTTLNPIIQNGLKPVFVGVDIPSLNLNLDHVESLLKADTKKEIKAIAFAHVLGNPPDMDRLMALVDEYSLIFLEDACDALGSTYKGQKLGSFGVISTCSFFPAHHMTMGEGGFVATDNPLLRRIISSLRDWGRACYCNTKKPGDVTAGTACGDRFRNWLPGAPNTTYDHRYVFDEIGYNLKPLDLQAAIGLEQIDKLEEMHDARKVNFDKLYEIFKPYKKYFHLPEATEGSDPSWFAFLMTIKEDAPFSRHEIVTHLEAAKIQTRSYFSGNILYHPGYHHMASEYDDLKEEFPNAHLATYNSFFLGTFIGLTDEKLDYIKKSVDKFFEELSK